MVLFESPFYLKEDKKKPTVSFRGVEMRGYLSFVLVLASVVLVFTLLEINMVSKSFDLSKAISVERAYGLQMNVKESILESARQGARDGFNTYDFTHDIKLCKHCPDSFCLPPTPPLPTNYCDPLLCAQCFRESEARMESERYAVSNITTLGHHHFDSDFRVFISQPTLKAFTTNNSMAKNGFSLDYLIFDDDLRIDLVSDDFDLSAAAKIPEGVIINESTSYN